MSKIPSVSSIPSFFRTPSFSGRYTLLTASLVFGGIALSTLWYLYRSRHPKHDASSSAASKDLPSNKLTQTKQDEKLQADGFVDITHLNRKFYWNLNKAFNKTGSEQKYPASLPQKEFVVARKDFQTATLIGKDGHVYRLQERDLKKEPIDPSDPMFSKVEKISINPLAYPQNTITSKGAYDDATIIWARKGGNVVFCNSSWLTKTEQIKMDGKIQHLASGRQRFYVVTDDKTVHVYNVQQNQILPAFSQKLTGLENPICSIQEYGYGEGSDKKFADWVIVAEKAGFHDYDIRNESTEMYSGWGCIPRFDIQEVKAFQIKNFDRCFLVRDMNNQIHFRRPDYDAKQIPNSEGLDISSAQFYEGCLFLRGDNFIDVYNLDLKKMGRLNCSHNILDLRVSLDTIFAMGSDKYTVWDFSKEV